MGKRTTPTVQQVSHAAAAHEALTALWRRQYVDFFSKLQTHAWDSRLQPLALEVIKRSRESLLDRIGDAYKVIAVERVGSMLGLDTASAAAACEGRGWAVDASGFACPVPVKKE